jgi:hypothetical protein
MLAAGPERYQASSVGGLMRRPAFAILAVLFVAALAGCSSSIVMQNPETKEIVPCAVTGVSQSLVDLAVDYCAKAYEKAGWVRVAQ